MGIWHLRLVVGPLLVCAMHVRADDAPSRPGEAPPVASTPSPSYDGKWTLRFKSDQLDGPQPYVSLTISGDLGVWNRHSFGYIDPCANRDMPVVVERRIAAGIVFRVEQNKVIPGCNDIKLGLRRVDDNRLEAKFQNGDLMTMTRD